MEKPITIIVEGKPVAKGRARIGRMGNGRAMAYTPKKTRDYENIIKRLAVQAMAGQAPTGKPVTVQIKAVVPIPKSFSKMKTAAALSGALLPVTRPDIDNYAKAALDALNKIVFGDDSQVIEMTVSKVYGDDPRLIICVQETVFELEHIA